MKVNNYLKASHSDLQTILSKVKALEEINAKVQVYLSDETKKYCQVANFTHNRLILLVANGSIATQLRFQTADLLRKFKADTLLNRFHDIQCKVRPTASPTTKPSFHKVSKLSEHSATLIRYIAESLDDPKLKAALGKIADHVED